MKILFTGDVMFDRSIKERVENGENPFEFVQEVFDKHDGVVINLETNVSHESTGQKWEDKSYSFKSPIECLNLIKKAGIEIVNLANNHSMDYGSEALIEQLDLLDERAIKHFGAGRNIDDAFEPLIIDTKEGKIAFLGFNCITTRYTNATENYAGAANFDRERIIESFDSAKEVADLIFVFPHWGHEFTQKRSKKQEEYSREFPRLGANLVVGNHPHVPQMHEIVDGVPVFYSLGNFVFDSRSDSPDVRKTFMVSVEVKHKKMKKIEMIFATIDDKGYPHPTGGIRPV